MEKGVPEGWPFLQPGPPFCAARRSVFIAARGKLTFFFWKHGPPGPPVLQLVLSLLKNVLFPYYCTPMYASQLCCNFRKSWMQRLRVAYNFGCRALYNLPWKASVSNHQVQCNIRTFETQLRKYTYLFLERCRKSNNVWSCALMQSDCLYSSLFFEHYNRILLCEWVIEFVVSVWSMAWQATMLSHFT